MAKAKAKAPALDAHLTAARDAVRARDLGAALAELLEAWRVAPAAAIADAISAISARAVGDQKAPTGKTAKARNDAWDALAVAGDPVARGILVASLTETKGNAETLARIELLVEHLPDPRVSAKICDLVQVPIYNVTVSRTRAFWKRVFPLLAELGDPRIAERARGFVDAWAGNAELNEPERPELAKWLGKVQLDLDAAYRTGVPVLAPADAARCAEVVAALAPAAVPNPASARTEAELLAAIYAAPDDDDARLVYADWLQQRSDPRGELIVLQIARARGGKPSPDAAARERDLIAEYGARWLAPLPIKKGGLRFERGFVAVCETTKLLGDEPAWATVREVNSVPASDRCATQSLRTLVDLEDLHVRQLAKLERALPVESLAFAPDLEAGAWVRAKPGISAWGQIRALPKLARVEILGHSSWTNDWNRITPAALAWAWSSALMPALRELAFVADPTRLADWLAATAPSRLRELELRSAGRGEESIAWRLIARRTDDGAWTALDVIAPRHIPDHGSTRAEDAVCAGVAALPSTPITARIAVPPMAWDHYANARTKLQQALAGADVTVEKSAT